MRFKAVAAVMITLAGIGTVRADYLPQIVFLDASATPSYTPGEPFTFELEAPPLVGQFNYDVTLQLSVPGYSGSLPINVTVTPPATGYPFHGTSNFVVGPAVDSGTGTVSVEVADSSGSLPVATPPGLNVLAVVTVDTSTNLELPITVGVVINSYHVSGNGELGFTPPPAVTVAPKVAPPSSVPAPGTWLMFGCGGLSIAVFRNRFARKVA